MNQNERQEWEYPDHYERIAADKMNDEGALKLAEAILDGIREEAETIIPKIRRRPSNPDYRRQAKTVYNVLSSDFVNALAFGHGGEAARSFYMRCPKGVLDDENDDGEGTHEVYKRKARSDIGKPRKAVRSESSAVVNG